MENNKRYDMNGNPYSYQSLKLKKAEIAKVCQEINTNYNKYKNKPLIIHRTRDIERNWCIYYIENRGYSDYNIIEKYYDQKGGKNENIN